MRTPDLRPDRPEDTPAGPPVDRPATSDRPDGSARLRLSDCYRDDPYDIFPADGDEPEGAEDSDEPTHAPRDYTPEARALADDLGFDPHTHSGPLADRHTPGVHDPVEWPPGKGRYQHELRTAALIAADAVDVRLGPEDHARAGVTHVDSIVRYTPDDPGTPTEFKALVAARNIPGAIKGHIVKAVTQLEQHVTAEGMLLNGHVVVDGSACGLNETDMLRGCLRLVGQANAHGQKLPKQIRFILGDMTSRFFDPATSMDDAGSVRFDRPNEHSFRTTRQSSMEDPGERY